MKASDEHHVSNLLMYATVETNVRTSMELRRAAARFEQMAREVEQAEATRDKMSDSLDDMTRGYQSLARELANATAMGAHQMHEAEKAKALLRTLLDLKEYKDTHGKTPVYLDAQPKAWDLARELLREEKQLN